MVPHHKSVGLAPRPLGIFRSTDRTSFTFHSTFKDSQAARGNGVGVDLNFCGATPVTLPYEHER
jgi:hypothetical protein